MKEIPKKPDASDTDEAANESEYEESQPQKHSKVKKGKRVSSRHSNEPGRKKHQKPKKKATHRKKGQGNTQRGEDDYGDDEESEDEWDDDEPWTGIEDTNPGTQESNE